MTRSRDILGAVARCCRRRPPRAKPAAAEAARAAARAEAAGRRGLLRRRVRDRRRRKAHRADTHRRGHVLEAGDLRRGSGKPLGGFALPSEGLFPVEMELLAGNAGVVIVGREKYDDLAPLYAFRFDGAGKPAGKVGPATAFGRPPADGTGRARLLVAFTRKLGNQGRRGDLHRRALRRHDHGAGRKAARPQGRRHRRAEAARACAYIGFFDGYTRVLERTPGRLRQEGRRAPAVQDGDHRRHQRQGGEGRANRRHRRAGRRPASSGSSTWAGRVFVELNEDGSGVDVVDAMGKKQPATLAVPFHLYDPKSLRVEEGPTRRAS